LSLDKSIYGYLNSWGNREYGAAMWESIKSAYKKRLLFLFLALPFDLLVMPYVFIRRLCGPARIILLTNKWPKLANALPSKNLLFIGTPREFVKAILRGAQYFPAAPVYFLNVAGIYCARKNQVRVGNFPIPIAGKILKLLCNATHFKVLFVLVAMGFLVKVILVKCLQDFSYTFIFGIALYCLLTILVARRFPKVLALPKNWLQTIKTHLLRNSVSTF
jgi:hypothetical protein